MVATELKGAGGGGGGGCIKKKFDLQMRKRGKKAKEQSFSSRGTRALMPYQAILSCVLSFHVILNGDTLTRVRWCTDL